MYTRERRARVACLGALLFLTGCGVGSRPLGAPISSPAPSRGTLHAGFGRADITPPPGVGLQGYGPEGKRARGYRHRLYARCLYLEDANGERLAFVVADLGQISTHLHRAAAESLAADTGLGADRLVLSATHTHSGPSHYFGFVGYNEQGSRVAGYDESLTEHMASGIADAVRQAVETSRPARLAWGSRCVWGVARNRSLGPHLENDPMPDLPCGPPPDLLTPEQRSIDPTLTMIRVDLLTEAGDAYEPWGAFSLYAIHATGNPSANELLDGDIHALVERGLERHIERTRGEAASFAPKAFHLFANGAEGDVSPDWPLASRSPIPKLERLPRPGGPKSPPGGDSFVYDVAAMEESIRQARRSVEDIGDTLASHCMALFEDLGDRLSSDVTLGRSFETVDMKVAGACYPARVGTATPVGGVDGRTRFLGWRLLGLFTGGFDACRATESIRGECQNPKRLLLGPLHSLVTANKFLPTHVQLAVVRVGDLILAAIPVEATTTVGYRIREAIARDLPDRDIDRVRVLGLANGYVQYAATPEEYGWQCYEGASTIFGPRESVAFTERLARLARDLPSDGEPSPPADVLSFTIHPGKDREVVPREARPGPVVRSVEVEPDSTGLRARWVDAPPGPDFPSGVQVLEVQEKRGDAWETIAWDDHRHVEVWERGSGGDPGHRWEMRWYPRSRAAGTYRVRLLPRAGGVEEVWSRPVDLAP